LMTFARESSSWISEFTRTRTHKPAAKYRRGCDGQCPLGGKADIIQGKADIKKCPLNQSGITELWGLLAVQWLLNVKFRLRANLMTHSAAARMLAR
jgi:hypothetical protein